LGHGQAGFDRVRDAVFAGADLLRPGTGLDRRAGAIQPIVAAVADGLLAGLIGCLGRPRAAAMAARTASRACSL